VKRKSHHTNSKTERRRCSKRRRRTASSSSAASGTGVIGAAAGAACGNILQLYGNFRTVCDHENFNVDRTQQSMRQRASVVVVPLAPRYISVLDMRQRPGMIQRTQTRSDTNQPFPVFVSS